MDVAWQAQGTQWNTAYICLFTWNIEKNLTQLSSKICVLTGTFQIWRHLSHSHILFQHVKEYAFFSCLEIDNPIKASPKNTIVAITDLMKDKWSLHNKEPEDTKINTFLLLE